MSALHTHGERQVNTVRLKSGSNLLICDDALPAPVCHMRDQDLPRLQPRICVGSGLDTTGSRR